MPRGAIHNNLKRSRSPGLPKGSTVIAGTKLRVGTAAGLDSVAAQQGAWGTGGWDSGTGEKREVVLSAVVNGTNAEMNSGHHGNSTYPGRPAHRNARAGSR